MVLKTRAQLTNHDDICLLRTGKEFEEMSRLVRQLLT